MSPRKLSQILAAGNALGDLAAATRHMEQLQRIYLEAVPAPLGAASRVGWARAGVLSVLADNGAIATMLRHTTPRILACFAGHGFQFNSMRIRVQVGATGVRAPATDKKPLSKDAVHAIEQALQQLPASELRSALARLVRRRGERTRED